MIMQKWIAGASLVALSLCGAAHAAGEPGPGPSTRTEVQAKAEKMFALMDTNGDGRLDETDRKGRDDAMFARIDTDKDGKLSREELAAARERRDGMRGVGGRGGMRGPGPMIGMADTNNDRMISKAEFVEAALRPFDRADTNRDGKISDDERQAARQAMRGRFGGH